MKYKEIVEMTQDYVMNTYGRYPIALERGEGAYVYDPDGRRYLDFLSGLAVVSLGHANKEINDVLKKQLDTLTHTSNLYYNENQALLAKKIGEISFEGKTFFCNSGAEANEAAFKLARLRGNSIKEGKNKILSLKRSFHGRTIVTVTLTGQTKYQEGFQPLTNGIAYVEPEDMGDLEKQCDDNLCAIFMEVVQAEGGIYPLSEEFLQKARELCDKYNALFILDEVQVGMGRTCKFFGYQNYNIKPDVITLAKALGNGIPIGAMHASKEYADILSPGKHASTFGGNYLATAAGNKVIDLLKGGVLENAGKVAKYLWDKLNSLKQEYKNIIKDVRGLGMIIGIEMTISAKETLNQLHENGVLANAIGDNILRILPPLISTEKEVDLFCDTFEKIIKK